jgi:biopolymer transport protein ExbD/biopolymer transport protein TolR
MAEKQKKRKEAVAVADINVTPMVDVMLVLLIIFMVITPMLSKGVSVELVKTKNPIAMPAQDKSDAVTVGITHDGKVWLNTTQTTADMLAPKVKDLLTNKLDKTVFIKADQRSKYEVVLEVVQNLQAAGVDNVGMLTEQLQEKAKQAEGGAAAPAK